MELNKWEKAIVKHVDGTEQENEVMYDENYNLKIKNINQKFLESFPDEFSLSKEEGYWTIEQVDQDDNWNSVERFNRELKLNNGEM